MRDSEVADGKLEKVFTYHAPEGDQQERYVALRTRAHDLAKSICLLCPESAERTIAIRKVQEVLMFANASIAINEA